jgi:hypothetical protein
MNTKTILLSSVAALTLSVVSVSVDAHGGHHGHFSPPPRLEGAWEVTVTPYVCSTGELLTAAATGTYMTFGARGTLAESTSHTSFQPGQRSTSHGFWERTGPDTYRAVFQTFVLFTSVVTPPALPRYTRGTQRVEHGIELVDNDHWQSSATVLFFDTGGTQVPPSGCAVAAAVRMD